MVTKKNEKRADVAIGYVGTYQDKQTGSEGKYIQIILNVEALKNMPIENGSIRLIGFPNSFKKEAKHPDFIFRPSKVKKTVKASLPF